MAGAAVMGMAGEMLVTPFGALTAGFLAGLIPPLGFRFLTVSRLGTAEDTGPRSGDHPPPGEAALPTCCGTASPGKHPPSEPRLFLTFSPACPGLQAENPGHVWGSQRPRAAGDPGRLAGDAADGTGHRRCLRWQVRRAKIRGGGDATCHAGATTTPEMGDAPHTLCYSTPLSHITRSHEWEHPPPSLPG